MASGITISRYALDQHLNPLGELHVEVTIDFVRQNRDAVGLAISAGGYVYDYQTFRGIVWPLSRAVRETPLSDVSVTKTTERGTSSVDHEVIKGKHGGKTVSISLEGFGLDEEHRLEISFIIEDIVNRDIVYHEIVYPVIPPSVERDGKSNFRLDLTSVTVTLTAHFAYEMRSFATRADKANLETGSLVSDTSRGLWNFEILHSGAYDDGFVTKQLEGDVIKTTWKGRLDSAYELDLHLQGSHLPVLAKFPRPAFWGVIWLLLIVAFLVSSMLSFSITVSY